MKDTNDSHASTRMACRITVTAILATLQLPSTNAQGQLLLRLHAAGNTQIHSASNIVLHVPSGGTPSPFLPSGPFVAEWSGWLNLDLRADFQFQAQHAGAFSLEINGSTLFDTPQSTHLTDWSRPVRLKKGTNSVRVLLSRTNNSEANLRLSWRGRGVPPSPIPPGALQPTADLDRNPDTLPVIAHRGRDLFLLHRCAKCHTPEVSSPIPDLAADAPSFKGIGSRRNPAWIARWIRDPQALQSTATMPRVLHGPSADTDAAHVAIWLGSLTAPRSQLKQNFQPVPAIGRSLVETLLCRSCHTLHEDPDAPEKIALRLAGEKFATPGNLAEYLKSPERHFAWSRMPNFQLSEDDAAHIASFVMHGEIAPPQGPSIPDPNIVRRGKEIAGERGCFQCHDDPEPTSTRSTAPAAPPVSALARNGGTTGCLAEAHGSPDAASQRVPRYRFSSVQRADLAAFLRSGNASLGRHEATDFARRWTRELRCLDCHEKLEGLPRLEQAGEKFRPEWLAQLLGGHVGYKPRPWLASRMPAFPTFAKGLAEGFAAIEGLPARSPEMPPPDPAAAAVGRKLVSASAGFSCVTCHAIGAFTGSSIFEAPGVNLAHAVDRLRPDYFFRWVRNPQTFDPATKMPLYFDEEGNSALADYFGGDGPKTLHALWEYLRPGLQITPPEP